jgi:hypothetical protein
MLQNEDLTGKGAIDVDEFFSLMDGKLSVSDAILDQMSKLTQEGEEVAEVDLTSLLLCTGHTAGSVPVRKVVPKTH